MNIYLSAIMHSFNPVLLVQQVKIEYALYYGANHFKIFQLEAELYMFEVPYIMLIINPVIPTIPSISMS